MPISRRTLVGVAIGARIGVPVLAGCSTDGPGLGRSRPSCVPRSDLVTRGRIGDTRLVYDISGEPTRFRFDAAFHDQLGRWLTDYRKLTGEPVPEEIRSFGAWTDGSGACDSWHNAGRAFDLARLVTGDEVRVSCRYDLWRSYTGSQLDRFRTRYWRLAATLHLHFAYVLTYLYNTDHHNHIHVDNGRSGAELSTFSRRSTSQVQAVQGMLNHVWDEPVPITGDWDDATSDATRSVLQQDGGDGSLDGSTESWHRFLRATAAQG